MIRQKIVDVAAKEVGYQETPANTNRTKYGKWFGFDGVAWCAIFVSWVYDKAGVPLGNMGWPKGFAGCQSGIDIFRKKNRIIENPQEGDIVFFDWNLDGRYDHVGIFVKHIDKNTFETIEGNTSLTNQSNGGQVMRRTRKYWKGVVFVSPKVLE